MCVFVFNILPTAKVNGDGAMVSLIRQTGGVGIELGTPGYKVSGLSTTLHRLLLVKNDMFLSARTVAINTLYRVDLCQGQWSMKCRSRSMGHSAARRVVFAFDEAIKKCSCQDACSKHRIKCLLNTVPPVILEPTNSN